MVYDYLSSTCGRQFVESIRETPRRKRRFPSPAENVYDPAMFASTYSTSHYQIAHMQQQAHQHQTHQHTHPLAQHM